MSLEKTCHPDFLSVFSMALYLSNKLRCRHKNKTNIFPEHQTREKGKSFTGLGSIRPIFGLTISENMKGHIRMIS